MDFVALDKDGTEMGIISAEDFISISTLPRMVQKDTVVRIKVKYSDKNWILIRDMYAFCDNEVRDVVVEVDEWKVGDNCIAVLGFMTDDELADAHIKETYKMGEK